MPDLLRYSSSKAPGLLLLLLLGAGQPVRLRAEESLGRAVPSDALFYFRYRSDAPGGFAARLHAFHEALGRVGFLDGLKQSLKTRLEQSLGDLKERAGREPSRKARERLELQARETENDIRQLELDVTQWGKILARVEWWKLFSQEVVLAGRREGERIAILVLFRVGAAERDRNLEALRAVQYGLCAIVPAHEIIDSVHQDMEVTVLHNLLETEEEICLTAKDDVLCMATSRGLLRQSLQLLAAEGSDLGYAVAGEHAAALAGLEAGSAIFPDGRLSLEGFQLMVAPAKLFGASSILAGCESLVAAGDAKGDGMGYAFRAQLNAKALEEGASFRRAFLEQPGVPDFARLVPRNVRAFEVSSGAEPRAFLEFLEALAKEILPGGENRVADFQAKAAEWYAILKKDVLPLLSGRRALLSLDDGLVILWELKKEKVSEAQARWNEFLPHLPRGLPVKLGVAGEFFTLSTSDRALEAALKTAAGASPGIAQNPEFLELWKAPPGNLQEVSYGECAVALAWLRRGLELLPLVGKLPSDAAEGPLLESLLEALAGFGPALEALDFLGLHIGYTLRQENAFQGAGRLLFKPPQARGF